MKRTDGSNPQRCQIRAAEGGDAVALSVLAMRSKAHWGYDDEFMSQCRSELTWPPEQIDAPQFDFQVCWLEKAPIAFYALERIDSKVTELEALFVEPQYIGKGIGRMMLQHAKARAASQGASRMVIQGDPNAASFYEKAGALLNGSRESSSIPGRQLPLYELNLSPQIDDTETGK